jgi:hypothetical protein
MHGKDKLPFPEAAGIRTQHVFKFVCQLLYDVYTYMHVLDVGPPRCMIHQCNQIWTLCGGNEE